MTKERKVNIYFIFSIFLIAGLLVGIVVASVYANKFQSNIGSTSTSSLSSLEKASALSKAVSKKSYLEGKKFIENVAIKSKEHFSGKKAPVVREPVERSDVVERSDDGCEVCPTEVPCIGSTEVNCIYNLINMPRDADFYLTSSVYYPSGGATPIGGFLTNTTQEVDNLSGIELVSDTPTPWEYDGNILRPSATPTFKFFIQTKEEGHFKSIVLGVNIPIIPVGEWHEVINFKLSNGFIVMTALVDGGGTSAYLLINYSPSGVGESIAIASEITSNGVTFPTTSPFYTSQIWRTIAP